MTPPAAIPAAVTLPAIAPEDDDAFLAMFDAYRRELDRYDPDGPDPTPLQRYREAFAEDGDELRWIEADGGRAGFVVVRLLPDWPDETRHIAEIAEFYVAPPHRRRRVGRSAVEALLAEHRARGTDLVEAAILHDNEPARRFWAALGFTPRSVRTARAP